MLFCSLSQKVIDCDTENTFYINAWIFPERPILDRHKCVDCILRYLVIRQITGILVSRQLRQHITVGIINITCLLQTERIRRTVFHHSLYLAFIVLIERNQLICAKSGTANHQQYQTHQKRLEHGSKDPCHRMEHDLPTAPAVIFARFLLLADIDFPAFLCGAPSARRSCG